MVKLAEKLPETAADLLDRLGGIPLDRIRIDPPLGTATEADLLRVRRSGDGHTYELIDGVLVRKAMGATEAALAMLIGRLIGNFAEPDDLGVVLGPDGGLRMFRGNVRYPDVTFLTWEDIGADQMPDEAIWNVTPSLAIEVLSESNTSAEIDRKLRELFAAGCRLAWVIDRRRESAQVYTTATRFKPVGPGGVLDGGRVLPGFKLPLTELFAATKRRKKKGKPK